jgi:hypothetical protein
MGGVVEGVFTWIDYFLVRCVRSVGKVRWGGRLDVQ